MKYHNALILHIHYDLLATIEDAQVARDSLVSLDVRLDMPAC